MTIKNTHIEWLEDRMNDLWSKEHQCTAGKRHDNLRFTPGEYNSDLNLVYIVNNLLITMQS